MISRAMKSHTNEHTVRHRPTLKVIKSFRKGSVCKAYERKTTDLTIVMPLVVAPPSFIEHIQNVMSITFFILIISGASALNVLLSAMSASLTVYFNVTYLMVEVKNGHRS